MSKKRLALTSSITIADIPEVMWQLRHEMAEILRDAAREEDALTAKRLNAIASGFEAGSSQTNEVKP